MRLQAPPRTVRPAGQTSAHGLLEQLTEAHAHVLVAQSAPAPWRRPRTRKRMRRFKPSADIGSLPNQNSRTLRASSMSYSGPGPVGLEQPFQLLRGLRPWWRGNLVSSSLTWYCAASVASSCWRNLRTASRAFAGVSPSASRTEAAISRLEP